MDLSNLKIHPAAAVFPMLSDDELAELADDIRQNGLNHPLVVAEVNGETVLVDGRNRLRACRLAGVEPEVIRFDGDPASLIISQNIRRRHLSKGQIAMVLAKICPEGQQGKRGTSLGNNEVSGAYVRKARAVLSQEPGLADDVLAGSRSLDDAYRTVQERRRPAAGPTEAQPTVGPGSSTSRPSQGKAANPAPGPDRRPDLRETEGRRPGPATNSAAPRQPAAATVPLPSGPERAPGPAPAGALEALERLARTVRVLRPMDAHRVAGGLPPSVRPRVRRTLSDLAGWCTALTAALDSQADTAPCPACDGEGCRWCQA